MASYVHGNVVRKDNVAEVSQRVQANRSKAMHMSKGYVAFLAIAAVVVLFACMQYLQLQSEITSRSNHITALQQELADEKEANTTRYNVIMNSMNLEEIREIAIRDFGMVYAEADQIIKYHRPDGTSVTQYAGIPESGIIASSDDVK
jgi:cell division protein FtsL